jgi:hypothetical protein
VGSKALREQDIILMDIVDSMNISVTKKRIFNNFRIYFQVNTLSELTNSQGTHIKPQFLSKYCTATYKPTSVLKWPNQKCPDNKYFTIWINIICAITGIDNKGK